MNKLVSVNVLNTNEKRYLGRCLDAVSRQTYPHIEVTVIDNASTDGSPELVEKEYVNKVRLIRNEENLGYVGGHNKGIASCNGEYVMPLNADVFMTGTFVEEKVKAMETAEDIGMVEGKLLQIGPEEENFPPSKVIDSTGLVITKSRRNFDRGHGQADRGQYDCQEYIFGASGAAPLYRRDMLEDIKIDREYFDNNFFIYREEVDLAWRSQLNGWKCIYTPQAVAYHVRGYSPASRKKVPHFYRQLQFRNRYLMMVKNDFFKNTLRHFPYIASFEIISLGYVLLREPHLIKAIYQFFKLLPDTRRKRKLIMDKKKVTSEYMRGWFT